MKKFANIFFLAILVALPSMVQSDYSASKADEFKLVQTATATSETGVPANGIYDPFLLFSAEANFSFSARIPIPQVSEKSQDQFSRDTQNRASHPNNTTSFIVSTNQIDVGLPTRKLIFPFHSFL
ncbi:MAG: hypothetical protein ABJH08_02110 [Balneola sp.]